MFSSVVEFIYFNDPLKDQIAEAWINSCANIEDLIPCWNRNSLQMIEGFRRRRKMFRNKRENEI